MREEANIRPDGPSSSMRNQSPIHPMLERTYRKINGVYSRARSRPKKPFSTLMDPYQVGEGTIPSLEGPIQWLNA